MITFFPHLKLMNNFHQIDFHFQIETKLLTCLLVFLTSLSAYGNSETAQEITVLTCLINPENCYPKTDSNPDTLTEADTMTNCHSCIREFHQDIPNDKVDEERRKMYDTKILMSDSHWERLRKNASSHHPIIRERVALELVMFLTEQSVKHRDRHYRNRRFEEPVRQLMLSMSEDPSKDVRNFICSGVRHFKEVEQETLAEKCANDREPRVRSELVGHPQWREKLAADPSPIVRAASASLSFKDDKRTTRKHAERFINDPDETVRATAVDQTQSIHRERIVPFLENFANDSSPKVRAEVVNQALFMKIKKLGIQTTTNHIRRFEDDPAPEVKVAVIDNVSFADSATESRVFEKYARDRSPVVRKAVASEVLEHAQYTDGSGISRNLAGRVLRIFGESEQEPEIQSIIDQAKNRWDID